MSLKPRRLVLDAPFSEPVSEPVGIIGLVSEEPFRAGTGAQQRNGPSDVSNVAGGQGKGDRSALIIGQSMDLARSSAARAPDRFRIVPFLSRLPSGAL